jgi:hypothetical protein
LPKAIARLASTLKVNGAFFDDLGFFTALGLPDRKAQWQAVSPN